MIPSAASCRAFVSCQTFQPTVCYTAQHVLLSSDLPWDYVPRLLAVQTTEVVIPLFLAGFRHNDMACSIRRVAGIEMLMMLVWLGVQITVVVVLRSLRSGNIRGRCCLPLPPLFIFWGIGDKGGLVRSVFGTRLPRRPGYHDACTRITIIALHPYENSYFNAWVGLTFWAYSMPRSTHGARVTGRLSGTFNL